MDLISLALAEDVGGGDVTVRYFSDASAMGRARIFAKQKCVIAGMETAREVFARVDAELEVSVTARDGNVLEAGGELLGIYGRIGSILTAERTALNFLQRLSAVATVTREYVQAVAGTGCRILDTRKTTPGFRALEKAAVLAGGGTNHRAGLYDMVMVKDNHFAGGMELERLREGIRLAKEERPDLRIEVEADTLEQVAAFYQTPGIAVILLDNMTVDEMRQAVAARPRGIVLEASGGITLETVRQVAETGVDCISVGALTHSAGSVDLSLEILGRD